MRVFKFSECPGTGAHTQTDQQANVVTDKATNNSAPDIKTFQGLILALQNFWAQHGCVVLQPLDMEVGAGTFHPATFLRSIGPETWNSAYVQPSRRPTDGRYGENPNRLQHYYQFQVVLKPSPDNIQELYLDSLRALGLDPLVHRIHVGFPVSTASDPALVGDHHQPVACIIQASESLFNAFEEDDGVGIAEVAVVGDQGVVTIQEDGGLHAVAENTRPGAAAVRSR